jgi:deazaflavin-dependent oxidoreductase (nitroreductase family)
MQRSNDHFIRPSLPVRIVNRLYGWLTRLGLGMEYSYLLQIAGRKTGKPRSVPVNILGYKDKLFLVAGRGHTQWSRNAQAQTEVTLVRGRIRMEFRVRELCDEEKPELLKAYLNRFHWMVWRFFPVRAGSPVGEFAPIASRYPVFELVRVS